MKTFKENDTVIYTDKEGKRFDTFVVFDTDRKTGLTHINHHNLKVIATELSLHPRSLTGNPMPFSDPFSFMLFNKLKDKYQHIDKKKTATPAVVLHREIGDESFAKAS